MAKLLWTQRSNFGPSPRAGSAMAYDSARNRAVLYGGAGNSPLMDTWEWDGSFWTQMEDTGPSERMNCSMAYDNSRKVSILFGGMNAQAMGDTWEWDGTNWTQLADSGPHPRWGHAMAFDSIRNRTVLFAGQSADNNRFSDTWEFDGENWTQQQDAGPAPRAFHCMAYDIAAKRVVMFGGINAQVDATMLGDTWAWDGGEWVQLAEFGPLARSRAGMASTGQGTVLYGGLASANAAQLPQADTWEFGGKLWIQRQDIGPGPLQGASMVFDSGRNVAVVFGGQTVAVQDEQAAGLARFSGSTWECPVAPPVPVSVSSISLGVHPPVPSDTPVALTITLSGPAPPSGAIVTFSGPVYAPNGATLTPVTIAPGVTTTAIEVAFSAFLFGGIVTIYAQTAGTQAASLVVQLQP